MAGCEKETIEFSEETSNQISQNLQNEAFAEPDSYHSVSTYDPIDHYLYRSDTIIQDKAIPKIKEIESVEEYLYMQNLIHGDLAWNFSEFGRPLWNHAIVRRNVDNLEKYVISIPLYKNGKMNALFRYILLKNEVKAEIYDFPSIEKIIYNEIDNGYFENHKINIAKEYYLFDYWEDGIVSQELKDYIKVIREENISNSRCPITCKYAFIWVCKDDPEVPEYPDPETLQSDDCGWVLISYECWVEDCDANTPNSTFTFPGYPGNGYTGEGDGTNPGIGWGSGGPTGSNSNGATTNGVTLTSELMKDCLSGRGNAEKSNFKTFLNSLPQVPGICVDDIVNSLSNKAFINGECDDVDFKQLASDITAAIEKQMQDLAGTFEFYSLEVEAFSPCSGDETDDLLEDAWNNMLEEGLCGTEGFEEAWDGLDKIEPTEAFLNCDFYNCFYEHLKNEAGDFWCEHLDEIFSADPEYNTLLLDVFEPDGQSGNPEGHAYWFTGEPNNTYMSFRKSDCNSMDQLKTASTFLHESLHASWKLEIIKLGLTTTDYAEIQTLWKIYVNEKYGINIGEHALMAKEFAEIIARELWKLNGGYPETENGWEYYMGYVYEGLEYEFGDIFEQDDIDHWMELKNKLNGANGENHNTYECQN